MENTGHRTLKTLRGRRYAADETAGSCGIVERMFCRFKDWRRIATGFDRNIKTFMGAISLAAAVIWWL